MILNHHKHISIALTAVLFCLPAKADHQPFETWNQYLRTTCAVSARIDHQLRSEGEAPFIHGPTVTGQFMRLYRNSDKSRWTVVIVYPDGRECLVFGGDGLEDFPWIPPSEEDAA